MKLYILAAPVLLVFSCATLLADQTSPLVLASRKSKEAKGTATRTPMVITNHSVKRSRPPGKPGKIQITAPASPVETVEVSGRLAASLERGLVAEKEAEVISLQLDLSRIEEEFYREADPGHRDKVLRARFSEVKNKLTDAKRELALLTPVGNEQ